MDKIQIVKIKENFDRTINNVAATIYFRDKTWKMKF